MIITKEQDLDKVLSVLAQSEIISLDFETLPSGRYPEINSEDQSLHHKTLEIEGLALRSEKLEPVYIPFKDTDIPRTYLVAQLKKLFEQDSLFVAHNAQFDCKIADYFIGARPKNKFCTLVGYYYLDENAKKDKVTLGREIFGMDTISYKEAKKLGPDNFLEYVLRDAEFAYQLYFWEKERLEKEGFYELVSGLEMDFIDVLIDMTLQGICVDLDYLKAGEELLTNKAIELEVQIHKEYGEFNLKSPMQLCEKIYGIKISRKNKEVTLEKLPGDFAKPAKMTKGKNPVPSTDDESLSKLDTPVANLVKKYREITKLLDTYAKGFQKWVIDGKIYPTFGSALVVTGRLNSQNPNMQNCPRVPTEGWFIRKAFYAPEGYDLIVADESQLEVRLTAHYSRDPLLISAICSGEDIHYSIAQLMFNKKKISKEERTAAKTLNFAVLYGLSPNMLAERLHVSKAEGKSLIARYFNTFPDVDVWRSKVVRTARKQGYLKTLIGRKRRIPYIDSPDDARRSHAERQSVNVLPQGGGSDILKVAMVKISKEFKENNLDAHILSQVHDEVIAQSRKDHTEEAARIIKHYMEHPFQEELRVPLLTEPRIVSNWAEAKE